MAWVGGLQFSGDRARVMKGPKPLRFHTICRALSDLFFL